MKPFGRKEVGALGEKLAARYLRRHKCRILGRNLHFGRNELDLVIRDGDHIAFVEVKTLCFDSPAEADRRPADAVSLAKRKRTVAAAYDYLKAHPTKLCPRMDVVEVYLDRSAKRPKAFKILHIPAAFDARGAVI